MKILGFLFISFCALFLVGAQQIIEVQNAYPPNQSLEFVQVFGNQGYLGNTDKNGKITIPKGNTQLLFVLDGYEDLNYALNAKDEIIYLIPRQVDLEAVEVINDESNARKLVREVIRNRKLNKLENLNSYQFDTYSKFWVTTEKDSIPFFENPVTPSDSAHNELRSMLEKSLFFIGERAIAHSYIEGAGKKNKIVASRISGTKTPIYEFVALQPIPYNLDQEEFQFFFRNYANPLSKKGLNTYRYRLKDSLNYKGRKTYELYFSPRKKEGKNDMKGYLFIDAEKKAPVEFFGENTDQESVAELKMQWHLKHNYFFPEKHTFKMETGHVSFKIPKDSIVPSGEIIQDSINKKVPMWAFLENKFLNITHPATVEPKLMGGYEYELDPNAFDKWNEVLSKIRPDSLSFIERNTYETIDSIAKEEGVEKNLKLFRILTSGGKYEVGKVNLDLTRILGFNDYEGFRLGLGLETNYKFSERFKLGGYTAYGFKDRVVKYGGKASYLLNRKNSTQIYTGFESDVAPSGRSTLILQNRLLQLRSNATSNFYNNQFYSYLDSKLGVQHDFFQNLTVDVSGHWERQSSEFNYAFNGFNPNTNFDFFSTQIALRWAPYQRFMQSPIGKISVRYKSPVFYLTAKQFFGYANEEATKLDLSIFHRVNTFMGRANFALFGGVVFGDIPLFNNFEGGGNSPVGNSIGRRFGVGGNYVFETMLPGQFYSNRTLALHYRQNLKSFSFLKKKIYPSMIYRAMWGEFENANLHNFNFQEANGVYQEVGFELNSILFKAIGIGAYYRFGAYNSGNFDNNFAIKTTFRPRF